MASNFRALLNPEDHITRLSAFMVCLRHSQVGYALTYSPTISLQFVSDIFSSVTIDDNGYKVIV